MDLRWLMVAALWVGLFDEMIASKCRGEPSCSVTRVHGMKSADCYKLDLRHFPRCLTGDAEIIDLTFNRIREITSTDLKKYKNLKILYLGENMITKIDQDAFTDKSDLHTLDLSYNGFSKPIPDVIFHLPSLKNLYLSQNQNINIIEILEQAVPITSPLAKLDISYNNYEEENGVQRLPKLRVIASLVVYNVSGMDLLMSTSDTAGLCNLKWFINDNVTAYYDDPCDCWNIEKWLNVRNVLHTPLMCTASEDECPYEIPQEDEEMYRFCKEQHAEKVYQAKLNNSLLIAGVSIAVVLVILLLVLYKWRRMTIKKRNLRRGFMNKEFSSI